MSTIYYLNTFAFNRKIYFVRDGIIMCKWEDEPDNMAQKSAFSDLPDALSWLTKPPFKRIIHIPKDLPSVATAEAPV